MKKRIFAGFLVFVMLLGFPVITYAGDTQEAEDCVTITLSVSQGSQFYTSKIKEVLMLTELTVPYFDLDLYGLKNFYYNPDCYTGEGQTAGTKETAEGKVTVLHAIIYATEIYELGIKEEEAGLGTLYEAGVMDDYMKIGGTPGSIFFNNFWGLGYNMNYYVNYQYPLGKENWGASADQVLLKDGDHISIHNIASEDESITGSSFAFFQTDGGTNLAETAQGEQLVLDLKYTAPGSNYETTAINGAFVPVYYTASPTGNPAEWIKLGVTDSDGSITFDTSGLAEGIYYVGTDSKGVSFTSNLEHAPGVMIVNIQEEDSVISYGDVNQDGKINATDASMILRYAAGAETSLYTEGADVNKDGKINATDASLILRYAAGIVTALPAEISN